MRLNGIKKHYKGRLVLDIPELSLSPDRRYALIGANGSGKSTLLRIMAGVLAPDEGSITISLGDREKIGFMPQTPYAFSYSVLKNVVLASKDEEKALSALKSVGMEDFINAYGNKLSGGESQRMAFARMIAVPRPLIILDEPTSATDIAGSVQVEAALLDYCEKHGSGVIFSTHSIPQAHRLAHEIIFMDHGRILERGETEEFFKNPQKQETREFLRHWDWEAK